MTVKRVSLKQIKSVRGATNWAYLRALGEDVESKIVYDHEARELRDHELVQMRRPTKR